MITLEQLLLNVRMENVLLKISDQIAWDLIPVRVTFQEDNLAHLITFGKNIVDVRQHPEVLDTVGGLYVQSIEEYQYDTDRTCLLVAISK